MAVAYCSNGIGRIYDVGAIFKVIARIRHFGKLLFRRSSQPYAWIDWRRAEFSVLSLGEARRHPSTMALPGPAERICRSIALAFSVVEVETRLPNLSLRWIAQSGEMLQDRTPGLATERENAHRLECPMNKRSGATYGFLSIVPAEARSWTNNDLTELKNFAVVMFDALRADRAFALARRSMARERRMRKVLRSQAQELWRRQALFVQTEKMVKVGGWETDLAANEMTWSDEIYRISGIPVGRTVSVDHALSFYPLEARKRLAGALRKTMQMHTPFDLDFPISLRRATNVGFARWDRSKSSTERQSGFSAGFRT